jgi:hypothetical protein
MLPRFINFSEELLKKESEEKRKDKSSENTCCLQVSELSGDLGYQMLSCMLT